jgi:hypothetical protein
MAVVSGRSLRMHATHAGLVVTVCDPHLGERSELVRANEDPSKTAVRAISRLDREA